MPQDDYNVANDSGANTRTDFNNQLSAIVQNNSGATEPSTMFAHMFWADTSPSGYSIFKVRNAANAAWATCFDDEGRWKGIDGSATEPSMSFGSDVNTGLYRIGADQIGIATGGTLAVTIDASQDVALAGDLTVDERIVVGSNVVAGVTLYRQQNIVGQGVDLTFDGQDGGSTQQTYSQISASVGDNTIGAFSGIMDFVVKVAAGNVTFLSLDGTDSSITFTGSTIYTPVTITTDTTPTAVGRRVIIIGAWTAGNDITDFDNETEGQELRIIGGDADCNVVDGVPIQLVGDVTWNAAAGAILDLVSTGGVWLEANRSDAS